MSDIALVGSPYIPFYLPCTGFTYNSIMVDTVTLTHVLGPSVTFCL